jgi:hypothetical protein
MHRAATAAVIRMVEKCIYMDIHSDFLLRLSGVVFPGHLPLL